MFAKRSIAWLRSLDLSEQDRFEVDMQLRLLEAIEEEVVKLDKRLSQTACDEPKVKLLMTLPGVSYATAVTLLGALGDVSRFPDGNHAAA